MNKLEKSVRFVAKHYKTGIFSPEKSWEKVTGQPKRVLFRPAMWRNVAAIAVLLIVAGTIFLRPSQEKVLTASDVQKISVLPDESKITIEPGARLTYAKNFGKENRRVHLSGKAQFEVSRNEEKPFVVQTEAAAVTVLGTAFTVSGSENETLLQIQSGKVRFEPKDFPVNFECTAEMTARFDKTEKEATVSSPESNLTINAADNVLKFSNSKLEEVCRVLTQYYNREISVPDNEKEIRLTSTFENKTIEEIVQVINLTLDANIKSEVRN